MVGAKSRTAFDVSVRTRVPELEDRGAATWGNSQEEALRNIQEVARMVIEEMLRDGEPIPEGVKVYNEPLVSVTV